MLLDVIGCGSAFSQVNQNSSILIKDDLNRQWLIDCGPTIPRALWRRDISVNEIHVIYFTHIHPDHCAGLPALLNQWKSFGRIVPLTIYCQSEQREQLEMLVAFAGWPHPKLSFEVNWAEIEDQFEWRDWQIQTAVTQHEMSNRAIRIQHREQALFYSGDGRPTQASEALMPGVDIAFQECASFAALPADASHGDFADCCQLVDRIDVDVLGLYHCWDEAIPEIQSAVLPQPKLFLSYDGLSIDLSDKPAIRALTGLIAQGDRID
jgi:ribonuclease BN (tRNA processing enzyme)